MNQHEVQTIQTLKSYPSITITLPTHRTSPDNLQDVIRLKKLVQQANEQLRSEFTQREVKDLLERLDQMVRDVDLRNTLDGLALFLNADYANLFYLPFTLQERVVIQDSFYTRDLVFAMNRTPRYWLLVLSEKPTRLYEGSRRLLSEIREEGFPLVHTGPGGEQSLPGGFGIKKSAYRDERHRQFFRAVDAALRPFLLHDPLPLVVVGVDRYLAFFNEVSDHKDHVLATITGSHDSTSPSELANLVWPVVEEKLAEARQRVFAELDQAVGERKFASTVGEVWRMAAQGRGRTLIVEEGFHYPARLDETGQHLLPAEDATAADVIFDAVDEIIETVMRKDGRVVFVESGKLTAHQGIALILRY